MMLSQALAARRTQLWVFHLEVPCSLSAKMPLSEKYILADQRLTRLHTLKNEN
jgi:hypothetical protein